MTRLLTEPGDAGVRLDRWLSGRLPDLSRSRIQALIKEGHIRVAGRTVKPHQKLATGAEVTIEIPPPVTAEATPEDIPLSVLYEDADIIVINKPAGMVVHPAPGHPSGTLVNALLHRCRDLAGIGGTLRPGIVHRLDKDTSGVIVAAKNEPAMRSLVGQFKNRRVRKEYLALVTGHLEPAAGTIESLVGRSAHDRQKMSAQPRKGRPAVTHYETVETFPEAALVRVRIETGRTHQIRVHMRFRGHPIVGDAVYGRRRGDARTPAAARQMLHAQRIAFAHPRTGERVECEAPLPPDMQAALDAWRSVGLGG